MSGNQRLPGLRTAWLGQNFLHLDEIDSTNSFLMRNLDLPHGQAVTASLQNGGKGRLGRSWSGEREKGLYLSFLLRDVALARIGALPLVVGLGVSRAVEALTGQSAPIKWSNDVLLGEKKLCGILCESRITGETASVVAGLGINLRHTGEELVGLSLVYATSLFLETGKIFESFPVAAQVLSEMEPLLDKYLENGFSALRQDYLSRCVNMRRQVRLIAGDGSVREGTAVDVSDEGELVCSIDGKVVSVRAGEVSVRGLYGYV